MEQRTTAREIGWILSGMILLFNCWYLIAYPLLEMCGISFTGMPVFLVGCVFGAVGAGLGLGVGMHLEQMRWNLKKLHEQDETAKQLLNKYILREIFVIMGIWVMGPALFLLGMAFAGESI